MKKILLLICSLYFLINVTYAIEVVGSGGQDAGNGGGFVVFEDEAIFYDFHPGNEVINPSNWHTLTKNLENYALLSIDAFDFEDPDNYDVLKRLSSNNRSFLFTHKALSLTLFYLEKVRLADRQVYDQMISLLQTITWIDTYGMFDLVPYCTLRDMANMDIGFSGAFDNELLNDRCDVYPVAYNTVDTVFINTKFFQHFNVTNFDVAGLIIHEVFQSYISLNYKDPKRSRYFLAEIINTLMIYNDPNGAIALLKKEMR